MQFLKKMKQRAAAATVVAVASVLTLGVGVANAAPAVDTGNMPTTPGSITIHKHKEIGNQQELTPDGNSNAPANPLKGVEFTVTKIDGIDLNKNEDWAKVAGLTVDKIGQDGTQKGTSQKVTTGEDGSVKADNLALGVYLVEESGTGANAVTKKAAPFFVTIPLPFEGKWIQDVHVYPKNIIQEKGTKEVTDDKDTHKVGDVLEWTINLEATTDNPKAFGAVDQLEQYLDYVTDSATVTIAGKTTTDFSATTGDTPKKHVKFALNGDALQDLKKGDAVTIVFKTKVTSMPKNGIVKNVAWPIDNDYNQFENPNPDTTTPPVPPITPVKDPYFGDYKFNKVDAADPAKPLKDAEFGLFQCNAAGNDVEGNAIATATSDEKGLVSFNGIYLGTFAKGTAADQATKEFCLKETKAPAGYVLSDKVSKVTIKAGTVTTSLDKLDKVTNTQQNGPDLPLTGAAGTLLLTVMGLGLLGAGAALYMANTRSRKQS